MGQKNENAMENHKPFLELLIVCMLLFGKHANISIRIMHGEMGDEDAED